jgi:hypothetical protein
MQAVRLRSIEPMQASTYFCSLFEYFRSTEEVIAILNKEDNTNDENIDVWASKLSLSRLKLAIKYEQKMVSFWILSVFNLDFSLFRTSIASRSVFSLAQLLNLRNNYLDFFTCVGGQISIV